MGSLVVLLLAEQRRGWSLMIFCARATRGRGLPSLDARSGRSISPHPWRENEQASKEREHRSMRAVKNSLPPPSGAVGESVGPRPGK
jgi:hypothetical protein